MKKTIRILICDDQQVVCEGFKAILSTVKDLEVVGAAYNGEQALEWIEKVHPDLVLMDLKMPVMNGIQATLRITQQYPDIRVLVLTTYDDDEWVFDAIRACAHGYLLKNTPREELVKAIYETMSGKTPVDPSVAGKLFSQIQGKSIYQESALVENLNPRERDVLRLIGKGKTNSEIARTLHLSEGTVKNLVSRILTKLQVDDRTQAALLAVKSGMTSEGN
ncbi:MAG: response regulator transcription factor [Chloroflexi bacterium]|nr:response regulator transcription factor [Chloroflexota bacterium]